MMGTLVVKGLTKQIFNTDYVNFIAFITFDNNKK